MKTAKLGTISHGTLRTEDLLPAFYEALRALGHHGRRGGAYHRAAVLSRALSLRGDWPLDQRDEADALVMDLQDVLQEYAPPYCYFGNTDGDGADFGFWLSPEWRVSAEEDGVPIVSDGSQVPDDYRGSWFEVSDHGNVALYQRTSSGDKEVWSIV